MSDSIKELTDMLSALQSDMSVLVARTEALEREIRACIIEPYNNNKTGSTRNSRSNSRRFSVNSTDSSGSNKWLETSRLNRRWTSIGMSRRWSSSSQSINYLNESNPVSPLAANIPCNEKGTDYKTLANQTLATVLAEVTIFDETDVDSSIMVDQWRSGTVKKDVAVYFKIDKYTQQRVMLSITTIECEMDDAVEYILDPKTRIKYDTFVKENYELERFDDNITFNYVSMQTKACIINYAIDICYLTTSREIGTKHVIGYSSILDNPYAPSIVDVQRAWLYHGGFLLEKVGGEENKIQIFYLMHVDFRMMTQLPHQTKNLLLEKQALILVNLREDLQNMDSTMNRFRSSLSLDQHPFAVTERLTIEGSLEMNLASISGQQYQGPIARSSKRTYTEQGHRLSLQSDLNSPRNFDTGSHPDLFFWSLDDTDIAQDDCLENITDYVTMANSAATSLFREYINVLEAVRFSAVCPEKLSWKILEKNDELWILEKIGSVIQCMAGVANIRATEKEITEFLKDPRSRFSYDETLHKTYVVSEINRDLRLIYTHHKARHCFIGHGRDFLHFQYDRKEGEKRILAYASCIHPKCPVDPKIERGTMYESGFIIEPLPETGLSSVVYIVKVDFGGSIPDALVRWVKRRQPKILAEIKKYFER